MNLGHTKMHNVVKTLFAIPNNADSTQWYV